MRHLLKTFLALALLALAVSASSQTVVPQGNTSTAVQQLSGWSFETSLAVPSAVDTPSILPAPASRKPARIMFRTTDSTFYGYDGIKWKGIGAEPLYKGASPTTVTVGNLPAGSNIAGLPLRRVLEMILTGGPTNPNVFTKVFTSTFF